MEPTPWEYAAGTDIEGHMDTLVKYAGMSESVLELGMRAGVSTLALLHGCAGPVTSVDVQKPSPVWDMASHKNLKFRLCDSRTAPIVDVDLLFIDTEHEGAVVEAELERHGGHARKWILFHDVVTDGCEGSQGGEGLLPAIMRWMSGRPWFVREFHQHDHGLLVLEKRGESL